MSDGVSYPGFMGVWKRRFAWIPVNVGTLGGRTVYVWLERYEVSVDVSEFRRQKRRRPLRKIAGLSPFCHLSYD